MGKRKHRPVLHQQEQCDVWLSTAEKKEQTPAAKRQKLFRPITNIPDLIISSQPIKAGTKQTDIKNFFASKSATAKENVVPSECVSGKPHTSAASGNKRSATELLGYQTPDTTAYFKSCQKDEAKYRSAIALSHSGNCSQLVSKPHSILPVSRFDENQSPLLHGERESDIFSSQDLNSKDLCKDSQGIPQIAVHKEESEDVTFTMGTQGCLKVKRPKASQHCDQNSFDRHGCLKGDEVDSEVAADPYEPIESSSQTDDPSDLMYSRRDAYRLENANVTRDLKSTDVFPNDIPTSVQPDSSRSEESEDITFTMGTQGCLKVKQSRTNGSVNSKTNNKQKCLNAFTVGSELFAKQDDIPDSANSQSIQASVTAVVPFHCDSSEREDSEDIKFTVGTQGCLKVKQARNQPVNYNVQDKFEIDAVHSELSTTQDNTEESQSLMSGKLSQDGTTTMDSQGCQVKDHKGHRSVYMTSEDSSQDVAFTMGSQGCLKVRDSRLYRSVGTRSEDSSQDVAFTVGSLGCLKVRDHKGQRSSITPSEDSSRDVDHRGQRSNITRSEDSSQDVAFTMGSQGCLKVRDCKDQRSNITCTTSEDSSRDADDGGQRSNVTLAEDSSQDVAFTIDSQGCVKVRDYKGQMSSITSEDSSQDVAFTMGSQGCLELRSYSSNITLPEESSQDAPFTMGSQGCMKVRNLKGHEPNFTQSQNSAHSSQDAAFTMSSQGCLKVRDDRGQRPAITMSEDSSQDIDFTVGSQGCLKVRDDRGQRSNITLPEESSQDVIFTVGSQGCLKVRDDRGQRSNVTLSEDSSEDVDFNVGSQGCLKVRDDKGHRSSKRQHSNLSEGKTFLDSVSLCREDMWVDLDGDDDKGDDDYDEDDEFSQTQDW